MIERKIFSKIKSILLKNDLLYSLACRHGKTVHVDNARSILSQASPKPESQMNVTQRQDWDASISESISNNSTIDVSVIVPCYKVEQFVRDCIKSITEQRTLANFEILAIDDGSPDKTGIILDELAKTDSRIRVIHQDNRGFSGARNTGIGPARGETLMFVDSDDILEPDAMEELYSAFREANCDFVTASYSMMNQDGTKGIPFQGRRTHGAPLVETVLEESMAESEVPGRLLVRGHHPDVLHRHAVHRAIHRQASLSLPRESRRDQRERVLQQKRIGFLLDMRGDARLVPETRSPFRSEAL